MAEKTNILQTEEELKNYREELSNTGAKDTLEKIEKFEQEGFHLTEVHDETLRLQKDTYVGYGAYEPKDYDKVKGMDCTVITMENDQHQKRRMIVNAQDKSLIKGSASQILAKSRYLEQEAEVRQGNHYSEKECEEILATIQADLKEYGADVTESMLFSAYGHNTIPIQSFTVFGKDIEATPEQAGHKLSERLINAVKMNLDYVFKHWDALKEMGCGQERSGTITQQITNGQLSWGNNSYEQVAVDNVARAVGRAVCMHRLQIAKDSVGINADMALAYGLEKEAAEKLIQVVQAKGPEAKREIKYFYTHTKNAAKGIMSPEEAEELAKPKYPSGRFVRETAHLLQTVPAASLNKVMVTGLARSSMERLLWMAEREILNEYEKASVRAVIKGVMADQTTTIHGKVRAQHIALDKASKDLTYVFAMDEVLKHSEQGRPIAEVMKEAEPLANDIRKTMEQGKETEKSTAEEPQKMEKSSPQQLLEVMDTIGKKMEERTSTMEEKIIENNGKKDARA